MPLLNVIPQFTRGALWPLFLHLGAHFYQFGIVSIVSSPTATTTIATTATTTAEL